MLVLLVFVAVFLSPLCADTNGTLSLYVNGTLRGSSQPGFTSFSHDDTAVSIFRRAGSPNNLAQYASNDAWTGVRRLGGVVAHVETCYSLLVAKIQRQSVQHAMPEPEGCLGLFRASLCSCVQRI